MTRNNDRTVRHIIIAAVTGALLPVFAATAVTVPREIGFATNSNASDAVREQCQIETRIPDDLPLVALGPHRITQAVLNLVVNAAEALPDGGRVRIWAETNGNPQTDWMVPIELDFDVESIVF